MSQRSQREEKKEIVVGKRKNDAIEEVKDSDDVTDNDKTIKKNKILESTTQDVDILVKIVDRTQNNDDDDKDSGQSLDKISHVIEKVKQNPSYRLSKSNLNTNSVPKIELDPNSHNQQSKFAEFLELAKEITQETPKETLNKIFVEKRLEICIIQKLLTEIFNQDESDADSNNDMENVVQKELLEMNTEIKKFEKETNELKENNKKLQSDLDKLNNSLINENYEKNRKLWKQRKRMFFDIFYTILEYTEKKETEFMQELKELGVETIDSININENPLKDFEP